MSGVNDIYGIDGDYVNRNLLFENVTSDEFGALDLSSSFDLNRKFDLAISLEVAEHIDSSSSSTFVDSLCRHSDLVIFGAATENQGGQNHLNEQWPEYWIDLFKKNGFHCYDIIRPLIWENNKIDWWYRQNVLVFSKNKLNDYSESLSMFSIIHPDHFNQKLSYIKELGNRVDHLTASLEKWENADKGIRKHFSNFGKSFLKKISMKKNP